MGQQYRDGQRQCSVCMPREGGSDSVGYLRLGVGEESIKPSMLPRIPNPLYILAMESCSAGSLLFTSIHAL